MIKLKLTKYKKFLYMNLAARKVKIMALICFCAIVISSGVTVSSVML